MSAQAPPRPLGRDGLPSLTSLRFFAAAFVVGYHLVRQVGTLTPLSRLFMFGRSGVTFFFVLSGVVLAWTYCGHPARARVFWARRFARIWPLHLAATALSVGLYLVVGAPVSLREVAWAVPLLHAWTLDPILVRGGNGATWSLSDEAFFYLCFPALLAVMARSLRPRRQAWLTLAVTTTALTLTWILVGAAVPSAAMRSLVMDYFPPVRVLQFAMGVAFGVALARGWRPRVRLDLSLALVVLYHLAMLIWARAVPETSATGAYSASQLFAGPVYLLVVLAAVRRDLEGRSGVLGRSWLLRLGHWSFALYLVHDLVIRAVLAVTGSVQGSWQRATVWVVVLGVSQVVAAALYMWVEHPAERYLRARLSSGRGSGPTVAAQRGIESH